MVYGYQVSQDFHVWTMQPQGQSSTAGIRGLQSRPQYGSVEQWQDTWTWRTTRFADGPAIEPRQFELLVIARMDGEELRRARFAVTYACLRKRAEIERDSSRPVTFLKFEDRSAAPDGCYAIVASGGFDRFRCNMSFHLVTTGSNGPHLMAPPDEHATTYTAGGAPMGGSCPSANIEWGWVYGFDEDDGPPGVALRQAYATPVPKGPAPAGMFPGTEQPIEWEIRLQRPDDSPHPEQRAVIQAGER